MGPQEFVSLEYDILTIDNIRKACETHFSSRIRCDMSCDILAGERRPSCKSFEQILDLKVVHIRFIEQEADTYTTADDHDPSPRTTSRVKNPSIDHTGPPPPNPPPRKRIRPVSDSKGFPGPEKSEMSRTFPKSLSVLDMLKLGKVVNVERVSEAIELYHFDINLMEWSHMPVKALFRTEKEPTGTGLKAFNATTSERELSDTLWVIKKYLPEAGQIIKATNQTLEQHTREVVQMHTLARNFAKRLKQELKRAGNLELYGQTLKYKKIFLGKMEGGGFVTCEGDFTKYINNNGLLCEPLSDIRGKAESLAHFSYERSNHELVLLDMQGCGHDLCDPEIAVRKKELNFS